MLKKRIIFTLLFYNGQFMLSRNFRLQNVGNLSWLQRNYSPLVRRLVTSEPILMALASIAISSPRAFRKRGEEDDTDLQSATHLARLGQQAFPEAFRWGGAYLRNGVIYTYRN